jgi:hypothetical protein
VNFLLRYELSAECEGDYLGWNSRVAGFCTVTEAAKLTSVGVSCRCEQQIAHPDQVVDGQRKGEHPIDLARAEQDNNQKGYALRPNGLIGINGSHRLVGGAEEIRTAGPL